VEGEVLLSPAGNILAQEWLRTPELRPDVLTDAFVVMPDHFHGVVMLDRLPIPQTESPTGSRTGPESPVGSRAHAVRPYRSLLACFVAGFKSSCTREYRRITGNAVGALWQRGFYEHVIRGLPELDRIRRYIADNPRHWKPPLHHL
jgi:REP element-mobilizing transposase RayT